MYQVVSVFTDPNPCFSNSWSQVTLQFQCLLKHKGKSNPGLNTYGCSINISWSLFTYWAKGRYCCITPLCRFCLGKWRCLYIFANMNRTWLRRKKHQIAWSAKTQQYSGDEEGYSARFKRAQRFKGESREKWAEWLHQQSSRRRDVPVHRCLVCCLL